MGWITGSHGTSVTAYSKCILTDCQVMDPSTHGRAQLRGQLSPSFVIERLLWPAHAKSLDGIRLRNDVEMHVRNRLMSRRAVVLEHVVLLDAGDCDYGPADAG